MIYTIEGLNSSLRIDLEYNRLDLTAKTFIAQPVVGVSEQERTQMLIKTLEATVEKLKEKALKLVNQ